MGTWGWIDPLLPTGRLEKGGTAVLTKGRRTAVPPLFYDFNRNHTLKSLTGLIRYLLIGISFLFLEILFLSYLPQALPKMTFQPVSHPLCQGYFFTLLHLHIFKYLIHKLS